MDKMPTAAKPIATMPQHINGQIADGSKTHSHHATTHEGVSQRKRIAPFEVAGLSKCSFVPTGHNSTPQPFRCTEFQVDIPRPYLRVPDYTPADGQSFTT